MAIQVQIRRGTTAQHSTFTGAAAELTFDTDLKTIRAHDGSTAGGIVLAKLTDKLSSFAATTSSELRGIVSDETGTGSLVFNASPTFTGTVNVAELTATGNVTSPFFYSQSDINLKKDIEPIVNALDIVKQLGGYSFKWKHNEAESFGLIAQYVEQVLPMLIGTTPDGSKTVLYNGIIALLLEAIKAQQVQIDEIKAKLDE